jgi:hypothetical protein
MIIFFVIKISITEHLRLIILMVIVIVDIENPIQVSLYRVFSYDLLKSILVSYAHLRIIRYI